MKGYRKKTKEYKWKCTVVPYLHFCRFLSIIFFYVSSSAFVQILMSISAQKANVHLICTSPIVIPYSFLSCVPAPVLSPLTLSPPPPSLFQGKKRDAVSPLFYMNIFCNIFWRKKKLPCLLGDLQETIRLMYSFVRLRSVSDVY